MPGQYLRFRLWLGISYWPCGGIVAPLVVTHTTATWQDAFSSVFLMFTGVLLFVAIIIMLLGEGRILESIGR